MKVGFVSLGCPKNQLDTEVMLHELATAGYEITPEETEADVVVINDADYAVFYRDLSEEMEKYIGKTLSFKGIVARDKSLPDTQFVVGRHVMTCCEADIAYRGLAVKAKERVPLETRDWVTVTGKLVLEYNKIYRGKGPVLEMVACDYAKKPDQEVATFF